MNTFARTPKQLGELLRNLRKANHLTQRELGDKSHLWQETISHIERGAEGTKIETIFAILSALDQEIAIIPRRKGRASDLEEIF